jgi:hypothetical protein
MNGRKSINRFNRLITGWHEEVNLIAPLESQFDGTVIGSTKESSLVGTVPTDLSRFNLFHTEFGGQQEIVDALSLSLVLGGVTT